MIMLNIRNILFAGAILSMMTGCAQMPQMSEGAKTGATVGAIGGAGVAALAGGDTGQIVGGAVVGAVAGGLIGDNQ